MGHVCGGVPAAPARVHQWRVVSALAHWLIYWRQTTGRLLYNFEKEFTDFGEKCSTTVCLTEAVSPSFSCGLWEGQQSTMMDASSSWVSSLCPYPRPAENVPLFGKIYGVIFLKTDAAHRRLCTLHETSAGQRRVTRISNCKQGYPYQKTPS